MVLAQTIGLILSEIPHLQDHSHADHHEHFPSVAQLPKTAKYGCRNRASLLIALADELPPLLPSDVEEPSVRGVKESYAKGQVYPHDPVFRLRREGVGDVGHLDSHPVGMEEADGGKREVETADSKQWCVPAIPQESHSSTHEEGPYSAPCYPEYARRVQIQSRFRVVHVDIGLWDALLKAAFVDKEHIVRRCTDQCGGGVFILYYSNSAFPGPQTFHLRARTG